ncbi:MAG: nitroreductase family protein [Deltaproteobacteria bacterium]|nr:nitroreductase family protein [Deltaproteobacteria bacterium]
MDVITIDRDRCNLCGLCIDACVRRILKEERDAVVVTDPALCILCGHCKAVCPVDAPQLKAYRADEFIDAPSGKDIPDPDKLLAFFRSRRSIRHYRAQPVEREKIERIIEAGRFAPTGGNRQHIEYVVVQSKERIVEIRDIAIDVLADQADRIFKAVEKHRTPEGVLPESLQMAALYSDSWRQLARLRSEGTDWLFYDAPALIVSHMVPLGNTSEMIDAGLSAMQMVLMAEALGLGTCFCGLLVIAAETEPKIKDLLRIPRGHIAPVSFLLGFPDIKYPRLVSRRRARVQWL